MNSQRPPTDYQLSWYKHLVLAAPTLDTLRDRQIAVTGRVPPHFYAADRTDWVAEVGATFVGKHRKDPDFDLCIVGRMSDRDFPSKTLTRAIRDAVPIVMAEDIEPLFQEIEQ